MNSSLKSVGKEGEEATDRTPLQTTVTVEECLRRVVGEALSLSLPPFSGGRCMAVGFIGLNCIVSAPSQTLNQLPHLSRKSIIIICMSCHKFTENSHRLSAYQVTNPVLRQFSSEITKTVLTVPVVQVTTHLNT